MFINNSLGHDANLNILEAIHMLSAAKKTSSAATIVHGFHKTRIVPQDECKIESGSDVDMVKNWQHLCQKLDAEAEFDGFIHVDDDVIAAPEVTGESGDDVTLVMRRMTTMMKIPLLLCRHPVWCDVFGAE